MFKILKQLFFCKHDYKIKYNNHPYSHLERAQVKCWKCDRTYYTNKLDAWKLEQKLQKKKKK